MQHDEQMRANQLNKLRRIVDWLIQSYETGNEYEKSEVIRKIKSILDDDLVS